MRVRCATCCDWYQRMKDWRERDEKTKEKNSWQNMQSNGKQNWKWKIKTNWNENKNATKGLNAIGLHNRFDYTHTQSNVVYAKRNKLVAHLKLHCIMYTYTQTVLFHENRIPLLGIVQCGIVWVFFSSRRMFCFTLNVFPFFFFLGLAKTHVRALMASVYDSVDGNDCNM